MEKNSLLFKEGKMWYLLVPVAFPYSQGKFDSYQSSLSLLIFPLRHFLTCA